MCAIITFIYTLSFSSLLSRLITFAAVCWIVVAVCLLLSEEDWIVRCILQQGKGIVM